MEQRVRNDQSTDTSVSCVVQQEFFNTYDDSASDPTTVPRGAVVSPGYVKSMTDIVTERFKERSARGEIINNPMNSSIVTYSEGLGHLEQMMCLEFMKYTTWYEKGYTLSGPIASSYILDAAKTSTKYLPAPTIDVDHLKQVAVTRAWANVDNSKVQALATLGEGKETITWLISILKRAYKILKAVKRLNPKDIRYLKRINKSPTVLMDSWMEARYAIRPLVYDAMQIIDAIKADYNKHDRQTFRGYTEETKTSVETDNLLEAWYYYDIKGRQETMRSVSCRAGVLCQVDLLNAPVIWGLDQPLEALWEITPWSVVADWFANIGETIASLTPNIGLKALASWVTTQDVLCQTVSADRAIFKDDGRGLYTPSRCYANLSGDLVITKTTRTITREVSPIRSIFPTYNVRLDALKLTDLSIMLYNLFKNRKVNYRIKS